MGQLMTKESIVTTYKYDLIANTYRCIKADIKSENIGKYSNV